VAPTTSGLTNGGATTHYAFTYDDSLGAPLNPGGPEPARTNAVIAGCEADFTLMAGWFGNIGLDVSFTIPVNVTQNGGGASWSKSGSSLTVTINPSTGSANFIRYLLVAEMVEQFMRAQGLGWYGSGTEGSEGEGLSRFLAAQFLLVNGFGNPPSGFLNSNTWLSSPRADFVNNINLTDDGPDAITGCATLFIWYLFAQLGFTINQIVAAGASTLGGVYRNLTGDTADPFPFFKQLLDTAFPGTATITSGNQDNPFPLGILSFWVDKSTYGRDEVTDVIASGSNGTFPDAFWLVLEGFNRNQFNALGIGTPALSGAFNSLPGITLPLNPVGVEFETLTNPNIPQRIRFPFDTRFANATLGSFPAAGSSPVFEVLNASASGSAGAIPGASAVTEFELVSGADPYYTNINPSQNNDFWLSQDLRVFTATPGLNTTPVAGGPAFPSDSFAGAYGYIQSLLAFLNNTANGFTDGSRDPFADGTIPTQGGALTGDSSVSQYHIQWFPLQAFRNYNFVVARVRLRGPAASQAQNVKVFFRMWSTQTADTGFDPSSTYLSHVDGAHPHWPLPAPDSHTIPFFATGNSPNLNDPNNPEYGSGGVNNSTVAVGAGGTAWAYFGCFLNVYDPGNVVNGSAVQALLAGTHHCIVAEIAYDDAPIVNANGIVMTPASSDKLAQRNLQLTFSDNPGTAETHRVPQTFDLKPGAAIVPIAGELLDYPDELMIDWGQTPPGSVAHIYWPQINAINVLNLANRLYSTHLLSASDGNTIDCTVGRGVTYVPIPPGTTENLAGLLTIDLPTTVVTGQEFDILVRRVATRRLEVIEREVPRMAEHGGGTHHADTVGGDESDDAVSDESELVEAEPGEPELDESGGRNERAVLAKQGPAMRNWRYVTGTFQVKIPVTTAEVMLRPDEDALAVMKWRLQQMAPTNRWHPVLERYISYLGARVAGLGGNPDEIPPSPDGAPIRDGTEVSKASFTGKVDELIYDCFGRFEGFVLAGCCDDKRGFRTTECGFEEILLRACKACLLVTVYLERGKEECIRRLVVHC
jgi:hypothetical protein